jgi:hypothetical protein
MQHKLEITGLGYNQTVKLDGEEIQPTSLKLDITPGSLPVLTVTPVVFDAEVSIDGVMTRVPPTTHDLLTRLGWTPPGEQRRNPS